MKTVDMHAHYVAPELLEAVQREGARHSVTAAEQDGRTYFTIAGVQSPPLPGNINDLQHRFDEMQAMHVDVQIISTWMDLSGYTLQPEDGLWLARTQNDILADAARRYPDRLVAMPSVPMQAPDLAVEELRRCVYELDTRGVEIGTNINSRNLDEPELDPFWAAAQEMDVPVFIHPYRPAGADRMKKYFLANLVGNPTDTTLAAASLIFGGVLDRFPKLTVCLLHGGGFLPYQFGRMDRGLAARADVQSSGIKRSPSEYMQRFYYDTIAHSQQALDYLYHLVGPERIMLGTDYPFEMREVDPVGRVERIEGITDGAKQQIMSSNSARAFKLQLQM